uniref:Uncharacterized protein n=1 Tax=Trichuris muris TaxID=70415 RepID=A0A5S6QB80_TRIMR
MILKSLDSSCERHFPTADFYETAKFEMSDDQFICMNTDGDTQYMTVVDNAGGTISVFHSEEEDSWEHDVYDPEPPYLPSAALQDTPAKKQRWDYKENVSWLYWK